MCFRGARAVPLLPRFVFPDIAYSVFAYTVCLGERYFYWRFVQRRGRFDYPFLGIRWQSFRFTQHPGFDVTPKAQDDMTIYSSCLFPF